MFFTAPVAITFGHVARRQIAATGQPGRKMANTGLAFGYSISLAIVIFAITIQG